MAVDGVEVAGRGRGVVAVGPNQTVPTTHTMKHYLTDLLTNCLTTLAGIGGLLLSAHLISPDQVQAANTAGAQLASPLGVIITLVATTVGHLALTLLAKYFPNVAKIINTSAGAGTALILGMAILLGSSCSQSQLAAYQQFASVVPITVGGSYDNITATWNSQTGITLLYNSSGKQVASVVPAATAGTSSAVVVPTTSGSGFANLTATVNPATGAVVLYNSSGTAVATIAPPAPASSSTPASAT